MKQKYASLHIVLSDDNYPPNFKPHFYSNNQYNDSDLLQWGK